MKHETGMKWIFLIECFKPFYDENTQLTRNRRDLPQPDRDTCEDPQLTSH